MRVQSRGAAVTSCLGACAVRLLLRLFLVQDIAVSLHCSSENAGRLHAGERMASEHLEAEGHACTGHEHLFMHGREQQPWGHETRHCSWPMAEGRSSQPEPGLGPGKKGSCENSQKAGACSELLSQRGALQAACQWVEF